MCWVSGPRGASPPRWREAAIKRTADGRHQAHGGVAGAKRAAGVGVAQEGRGDGDVGVGAGTRRGRCGRREEVVGGVGERDAPLPPRRTPSPSAPSAQHRTALSTSGGGLDAGGHGAWARWQQLVATGTVGSISDTELKSSNSSSALTIRSSTQGLPLRCRTRHTPPANRSPANFTGCHGRSDFAQKTL